MTGESHASLDLAKIVATLSAHGGHEDRVLPGTAADIIDGSAWVLQSVIAVVWCGLGVVTTALSAPTADGMLYVSMAIN